MKNSVLWTSLLLGVCRAAVAAPPPDAAAAPSDLIGRAQAAWERRADATCLQQALDLWEVVARQDGDPAIHLALARAHYLAGTTFVAVEQSALSAAEAGGLSSPAHTPNPTLAAAWHFAAGGHAASHAAAAATSPKLVSAATFWRAANLMQHAWARGMSTAYLLHPTIVRALSESAKDDPAYYHGSAHALLAAHLCRLPPELGGDLGRASQLFGAAQQEDPRFIGTQVMLAHDLLPRTRDAKRFVATLQEALRDAPSTPGDDEPEQRLERRRAAALLRQRHTLF